MDLLAEFRIGVSPVANPTDFPQRFKCGARQFVQFATLVSPFPSEGTEFHYTQTPNKVLRAPALRQMPWISGNLKKFQKF